MSLDLFCLPRSLQSKAPESLLFADTCDRNVCCGWFLMGFPRSLVVMSRLVAIWAAALALPSMARAAPKCQDAPEVLTTKKWLPSKKSPIQIVGAVLISIGHCVDEEAGRVKPECTCGLLEIGVMLQEVVAQAEVRIEGHTARSASLERDIHRGHLAARAVLRFLVTPIDQGGAGVPRDRLSVISYGSAEPIGYAPKDSRNDRVQIDLRLALHRDMPIVRPHEDVDYR